MADQNDCRKLKIESKWVHDVEKEGSCTLSNLMKLQKDIQQNVYNYDWEEMRSKVRNMSSFFMMNYEAIQDELRELREAMGGVDSFGSAVWKPWKKDHEAANERSFDDLTKAEKIELQFEVVDLWHFMFNLTIMVDLTPDKLYDMYYAKNKENIDRQERGY